MNLGRNIILLRKLKGVTQGQLAKSLGVSPGAVSRYESENGTPSFEILTKLVEFFDVSYDDLIIRDMNSHHPEGRSLVNEPQIEYNSLIQLMGRLERQLQALEKELAERDDPELTKKLFELRDELIKENPDRARDLGLID